MFADAESRRCWYTRSMQFMEPMTRCGVTNLDDDGLFRGRNSVTSKLDDEVM